MARTKGAVNKTAKSSKVTASETAQNSKTVTLVTGATSGMGKEIIGRLVEAGHVVLACGRRPALCRDVYQSIKAAKPDAEIYFFVADLSLMSQTKNLAEQIAAKLRKEGIKHIDNLYLNAGVLTQERRFTYEGKEYQWAVNYLSAFYLTHLLTPLLHNSKCARVITVTNSRHKRTKIHWKDIYSKIGTNATHAYHQSKLADLMFAIELDHRNAGKTNIHAYSIDPGRVDTGMAVKETRGIKKLFYLLRKKRAEPVTQAVQTSMYLLTQKRLPEHVVFYRNMSPVRPSKYALDPVNRQALWKASERALGLEPDPTHCDVM